LVSWRGTDHHLLEKLPPHQEVLALMQANGVLAPRLNCVNSVSAITRLLRDGFGIGALPPVLVAEELARGELTLLDIDQRPPNLQVVVSWRVGVEWVEEMVTLCQQVLAGYARRVGESYIVWRRTVWRGSKRPRHRALFTSRAVPLFNRPALAQALAAQHHPVNQTNRHSRPNDSSNAPLMPQIIASGVSRIW
jgi:hypothetical protein